ncbi:MAG TPA: MlaD family protein [Thermoleophilaceae bacterium]|nr:MlaD family protein [Thermoleophilaceae bacterium]
MKRAAAALLTVLACCGAVLALGANGEGSGKSDKTYEIVFDNAFGLTEGGDFKVAGVRAGNTSGFRIAGTQARPLALVEARVSEPGLADLRRDARCEIRPQSLIGEYFVECQPGSSDERLPDGGRVPVEQTSSTIPIDLVNDIMRRPYRDRLRLIVAELGAGLAGRPEDLSDVLRRAHPGLRETSETLRILGRQTKSIERLIVDGETVVGALEDRKADVTRFVREAGETAEIAASRRSELAESFARLPGFLGELEPYMGRLGELTRAQTPVLRDLQDASRELDVFLNRLRPFAQEGRPALEALGDASRVGLRAVRASDEEIEELRRLARGAPALAKPLRQFLQTIDDRRRAVEPDARAAASAPPPGDPTHTTSARAGFTGMEAIWNYFFWQALSTNAFDDVGHILRLSVLINECTQYAVDPSDAELEDCNQFLGPTQPGVTTPDPTRRASAATAPAGRGDPAATTPARPARPLSAADTAALDFLLGP